MQRHKENTELPIDDIQHSFNDAYWMKRICKVLSESEELHKIIYWINATEWENHQKASQLVIENTIPKGSKILDAGCGYGALLQVIDSQYDYTGMDLSNLLIDIGKYLHPDSNLLVGDVSKTSFADKQFDFVICRGLLGAIRTGKNAEYANNCLNELLRISSKVLQINAHIGLTSTKRNYKDKRKNVDTWEPYVIYENNDKVQVMSDDRSFAMEHGTGGKLEVSSTEFWKMRLYQAHASGRGLHTAIYDINSEGWNNIQNDSIGIIRRHMRNAWSVIDVGCGFGALSDLVPTESKYLGVDISPDLIEIARLRYPDKTFQVVDMSNLTEFIDKQFDISICRSVKNMLIDNGYKELWLKVLKEMRRISRYTLIIEYSNLVKNSNKLYEFLHNEKE